MACGMADGSLRNLLDDKRYVVLMERLLHFQDDSQEAFNAFRDKLSPRVTEWRWATEQMASPEPHYKKFFRGGKWRKNGKVNKEDEGHGFDAEGRLVVLDAYHSVLFDYRDDLLEEVRFESLKSPVYVKHYFFDEEGKLQSCLWFRKDGGIESTYHWEGERIAKICARQWTPEDTLWKDERWSGKVSSESYYDYHFAYGADGCWERSR